MTERVRAGTPALRRGETATALAERAYRKLLDDLLEGDLAPGQWLSVIELADDLSCSRVPVMEAMKRLAHEGFLEILPQVGCRVVSPQPTDVHDFFTLFAAVEGCVTRLAAERCRPEDVAAFEETCLEIERALRRAGGPTARDPVYRRLNQRFHGHIHRLARAPDVCRIAAGLWDRSDFHIRLAFGSLYFSTRVRRAHLAIRRAIVAGDPDAAEKAVEQHLRKVGEDVSRRLRERSAASGEP